jgi:hypothetical protein
MPYAVLQLACVFLYFIPFVVYDTPHDWRLGVGCVLFLTVFPLHLYAEVLESRSSILRTFATLSGNTTTL